MLIFLLGFFLWRTRYHLDLDRHCRGSIYFSNGVKIGILSSSIIKVTMYFSKKNVTRITHRRKLKSVQYMGYTSNTQSSHAEWAIGAITCVDCKIIFHLSIYYTKDGPDDMLLWYNSMCIIWCGCKIVPLIICQVWIHWRYFRKRKLCMYTWYRLMFWVVFTFSYILILNQYPKCLSVNFVQVESSSLVSHLIIILLWLQYIIWKPNASVHISVYFLVSVWKCVQSKYYW